MEQCVDCVNMVSWLREEYLFVGERLTLMGRLVIFRAVCINPNT